MAALSRGPVTHTGGWSCYPGSDAASKDGDADEVANFSNEECVAFLGVPVIDADWLRAAGFMELRP